MARLLDWKLAACLVLASVAASAIHAQSPVAQSPVVQSPVAEDPRRTSLAPRLERSQLQSLLNFEMPQDGGAPAGWTASPSSTVFTDRSVVHGGQWSARISRSADSPAAFSNFRVHIPIDFLGTTMELRGFLRTVDVKGFAGLWMREDGAVVKNLALDNMQSQRLDGTRDWTEYTIRLPLHPEARELAIGALLSGTGTVWVDDLQLLIDGKPIWDVPHVDIPLSSFELDHEFDNGSGISLGALSKVQIDNLATLGKVWGFLKYHHPDITSGRRNWDYDLFRLLPKVLAAADRTAGNSALAQWIADLGPVAPCSPCATLDTADLHLRPDLKWIADERHLGRNLSRALQSIYVNRPVRDKQFYVSRAPNGQPSFDHELTYDALNAPDAGIQLLALFRFWNIVEYWSPYRDLIGDWNQVLHDFILRVVLAKDSDDFQRQLMLVIAAIQDGHAGLWSSLRVRPPMGDCQLPVNLRFVENRPVVTGYSSDDLGKTSGLQIGDVVTKINGQPVAKLVSEIAPYYAASNEAGRLRDIGRSLTRGKCGAIPLAVLRGRGTLEFKAERVPLAKLDLTRDRRHDLPGDTFQVLAGNVAYLKLSSIKADQVSGYIEAAADTKGLIIDIRNYPSEVVSYVLGSHLVSKPTVFASSTFTDIVNPGAFHWRIGWTIAPDLPHYTGKIVILVDENSQSQSETTAMAFRAAPGAIVIGSTTAGADGNVSAIPLPGRLQSMISGIGVFHPDHKPTQRIGIVPDIVVRPTIAGIRAGRDEVLEAAIRRMVSP
jgi:C-terminal processing protease CtpA/Prc